MATSTSTPGSVDVFDLANEGGAVAGTVAPGSLPRLAASLHSSEGELAYEFRGFIDEFRRPAAELQLRGRLNLTCDRCNQPTQFELDARPRFFLVDESELHRIPIDETDIDALAGSTQFDLAGLIEDEAILALPLSPRHAQCPSPLADVPAAEPAATSPFAVLGQLKARKH